MITKSAVQHVAQLAKLKISETEAEKYAGELSQVLGYIDQLNEVDTGGQQIDIELNDLANRWRADKVVDWAEAEKQLALNQAEIAENNLVKVPKII